MTGLPIHPTPRTDYSTLNSPVRLATFIVSALEKQYFPQPFWRILPSQTTLGAILDVTNLSHEQGVKAFPQTFGPLHAPAGDLQTTVNTMPPSRLLHSLRTRFSSRACAGGARVRLGQGGLSLRPAARFRGSIRSPRYTSSMAPTPADSVQRQTAREALGMMERVAGDSGREYLVQKILQEKEGYPCRVYLAT